MKRTFLLICFFALAVSCQRKNVVERDTIPLVKQMAADTTGDFALIRSYRNAGNTGSIAIIGEPRRSLLLAERFLTVDAVDNIDGHAAKDRLPDFSGETFDVLLDVYNAPYDRFVAGAADSLREIAVRNALFAVDSVCRVSALNTETRLRKSRAKVLVLSSPLLSEYGQFDIDTLFKMAGKTPLILSPVEVMVEKAFRDGPAQVAAWVPQAAQSAYEAVAARMMPPGATFAVVSPEGTMDIQMRFRSLLRRYHAQYPDRVLDALLLDDFTADDDMLRAELEHIRREITEEDLTFSRMLAPGFRFIRPMEALTEACYRLLRRENLFTHNIAYPEPHYFQTEEGTDGDVVLVEISPDYISADRDRFMDMEFYVPDID